MEMDRGVFQRNISGLPDRDRVPIGFRAAEEDVTEKIRSAGPDPAAADLKQGGE